MTNQHDVELVAENKIGIQKNKRRIFELEAEVSTTYAELMLLLADIEESRAVDKKLYLVFQWKSGDSGR